MAHCRYCGEFLEDDEVHECTWRDLARRASAPLMAMGLGAICSVFALYYFHCVYSDCNPSNLLLVLAVVAGMLIGHAVWTVALR
jgi:hypothetical protein